MIRAPDLGGRGAPVSFLVDFDGTIARTDVTDQLMIRFATDPAWRERDDEYVRGTVGSRELLAWDVTVLGPDRALLEESAAAEPLDETFPDFVASVRASGAQVEVVSDGFGFYVAPALARLGLADLPIATSAMRWERAPEERLGTAPTAPRSRSLEFPFGHPRCFVCGTCKRERVLAHRAAGRAVVFIGDGTSDRFAAAHADIVFAKRALAQLCRLEGWAFEPWDRFSEITTWVVAAFADGRLPEGPDALGDWRGRHAPAPRPFICGPEVWGEGRTAPRPPTG